MRGCSPLLLLAACAGSGESVREWSGPLLCACPRQDGSVDIELTAPTASHRLALGDVALDGNGAEVFLDYAPPASAYVAQIVTQLRATVPAQRLGAARRVRVWVRTEGERAPALAAMVMRAPTP